MDFKFHITLLCVLMVEMKVVRAKGESKDKATCGSPGIPGTPGVPGNPGTPGVPGIPGRDGIPGSCGSAGAKEGPGERGNDYVDLVKSNWKQCAWKREDSKNTGLIQNCIFNKKYDNTSLRVFYEGNLYSSSNGLCNRWYLTFDGAECTKPGTIDAVIWVRSINYATHRHNRIEGYCNQVPKGHVRVGFWIGKCPSYSVGNGHTGWNSMSRIVIEEVPPPQL